MRRRLAHNIATAVVVLALQMTATMMTLRRDPLLQAEGNAIAGMLWQAVCRRTDGLTGVGFGSSSTSP